MIDEPGEISALSCVHHIVLVDAEQVGGANALQMEVHVNMLDLNC